MKILVIGETCKDVFWYGDVKRICPEGPVPVFKPDYKTVNEGMAGNVATNLKSLGIPCDIIHQTHPMEKVRYISERFNQITIRVDFGDDDVERISKKTLEEIPYDDYELILISDYNKGFLLEEDIAYISNRHNLTLIDTKKQLGEWARNLTFIKINRAEYQANEHWIHDNHWVEDKLLITLDKDGCKHKNILYEVEDVPVLEITGAGDTFVACFSSKYIKTKDVSSSIRFANVGATRVVQKRGVTSV